MKRLTHFLLFVLLASFLASCIVHTPRRRCRTDCWWEHGRRVCAERCR